MTADDPYIDFLKSKVTLARASGFDVSHEEVNPALKPHCRAIVPWLCAGGRRALFASFGLHKTVMQLEVQRLIGARHPGIRLGVVPLGVRQEFFRDARERFTGKYAVKLKFIRRASEIEDDRTIYLTNYESVREGILDISAIKPISVSLDEASILRGFGGTKTFRELMAVLAGDDRRAQGERIESDGVPFRFVATATPSPNEYVELLAYAAFLGIHVEQSDKMAAIIREYGLSDAAKASALTRSLGVTRVEVKGDSYRLVNDDCVFETRRMEENSIGLVLTSIPFSTQYEYSPNYADFGHTDNNDHFFEQMDFLTPELLRVLMPGRLAAVHVKDRIVPGGITGLGFQTVYPFSDATVRHFQKHGFAFMGRKTIVTDVVRENNQTYRLGWTEQCKDGSKMGFGMPEYLLLFRKPPTDNSNSYADLPVVKEKEKYTRARWQIDAHGFTRSSGNRLLTPEELTGLPHDQIFKLFRDFNLKHVYDFENHVDLGEALEAKGVLPVTFMLLQPPSWHPDVWSDITRMLSLNSAQAAKGKEMHLCPLQFDIVDRAIAQWSNKGETVYDPFGGLMTVPMRAVLLGRRGEACELNNRYFRDGVGYCEAAEREISTPTLFDLDKEEAAA